MRWRSRSRCSPSREASPRFLVALPRSEALLGPRLAGTFVAGTLAYAWRDRIPVSIALALAWLAASVALLDTAVEVYVLFGGIVYATLVLAYHPSLDVPAYRRFGDYSYGIYVYAFPTQQAIAALTGAVSPCSCSASPIRSCWRSRRELELRSRRRRCGSSAGAAADAAISARPP